MSNAFTRGLRRLFGIKRKRRIPPLGSIARPKLITGNSLGPITEIKPVEVIKPKKAKKKVVKKVVKKKSAKAKGKKKSTRAKKK